MRRYCSLQILWANVSMQSQFFCFSVVVVIVHEFLRAICEAPKVSLVQRPRAFVSCGLAIASLFIVHHVGRQHAPTHGTWPPDPRLCFLSVIRVAFHFPFRFCSFPPVIRALCSYVRLRTQTHTMGNIAKRNCSIWFEGLQTLLVHVLQSCLSPRLANHGSTHVRMPTHFDIHMRIALQRGYCGAWVSNNVGSSVEHCLSGCDPRGNVACNRDVGRDDSEVPHDY